LRDLFETVLKELPKGSTMALASRSEPPLRLARLRAYGLLSEIRTQQLAMTSAEAAALLARNGVNLDFELVQGLVSRTEGWPAMLSLAALTMRETSQDAVEFDGQHHLVSEYLKDEVLAGFPAELQRFALRTSMLDELSGPICDRLLQRRDSAAAIRRLARSTTLLLPKDRAHTCYRWHTLVKEALGAELGRTDPGLERTLRLRAAAWYSETGDTERALDQCSLAADAELTGDLLWRNLLPYLTNGKAASIRRWISRFQSDGIDNAPLALAGAFGSLVGGNPNDVQRWGIAAAAARARRNGEPKGQSLATGLAVIEAIDAHDGVGPMEERTIEGARSEPVDSLWRPVCLLLAGVAAYLQGDRSTAEPRLDEAARLSGSRAPALTSLSISQRAIIALEREDWELAEELTERARAFLEEWGLRRDPLSAFTYAAAAAAQARRRRIDEAKRHLRRGIELLAALGEFVPWYDAQARILLAHASLWLADFVAARALLAEASRFARRTPGAVIFSDWFDRAWGHMDTLTETSLAGPSALTIAELRILRFLPSHRSFREIAAQLGVSANTVKTQAHAVYRKLGVASRSQAVAQAIEAGLLA
jgi:LuxR family maltose regulon positive regulatory protein